MLRRLHRSGSPELKAATLSALHNRLSGEPYVQVMSEALLADDLELSAQARIVLGGATSRDAGAAIADAFDRRGDGRRQRLAAMLQTHGGRQYRERQAAVDAVVESANPPGPVPDGSED